MIPTKVPAEHVCCCVLFYPQAACTGLILRPGLQVCYCYKDPEPFIFSTDLGHGQRGAIEAFAPQPFNVGGGSEGRPLSHQYQYCGWRGAFNFHSLDNRTVKVGILSKYPESTLYSLLSQGGESRRRGVGEATSV